MAWYDFLLKPISFGKPKEVPVSAPRERGFSCQVYDLIEDKTPFSLVYILVKEGDAEFVRRITGGRLVTSRNVGVVVKKDSFRAVYDSLESLADAPFASILEIGKATFDPALGDARSVGDLMVVAQKYGEKRSYEGKIPVPEPVSEDSYAVAR